jgi:hypothetical protein
MKLVCCLTEIIHLQANGDTIDPNRQVALKLTAVSLLEPRYLDERKLWSKKSIDQREMYVSKNKIHKLDAG